MAKNICYAILFLAEAVIAWLYLEFLFDRRKKTPVIGCTFALGYIALFFVSLFNNTAANVIVFCFVNFFLICLNYHCATKTAFLQAALLSFLMTISEILVALLISLFGHEFAAYTYNFSVMVALVVMSKMLYLGLALGSARIFRPHKQFADEPRLMILFCGLPLLSTLLGILIIYIGSYAELNSTAEIMIVLNVFALLAVNLIFLVLYNHLQRASIDRLALQLSIQKEEADTAYYQALQEQYENQRILIHDIRNHLGTINGLAKINNAEEIETYILGLDATLAPFKQVKLCNDPILNMILLQFANKCREKGIDFVCDVRNTCTSFMDAPSTTALYGNLLSNALEAANTSSDKYIEITVTCNVDQNIVVISVINSCDSPPILGNNGLFITKKRNPALHGVGLKSIERIVHKYQGVSTMYYDESTFRFHHIIQFSNISVKTNAALR